MTQESPPTRAFRVVLYVDDSTHWHAAARLLGHFLAKTGGTIVVTSSLLLSGSRQRALEKARELLGLPHDRVRLEGRPGLIEHTLPDVARRENADLVVVGRLGSADRLTSGLIAHLIAKRTPASVLIARGRPQELRRILVCTEGARHGAIDFERAAMIAQAFDARLDVLHVVSAMGLTSRGQEEIEADLRDFVHSDAPESAHLRELEERLRDLHLEGKIIVRVGLVVEEILDAASDGYDLLVIGAHDVKAPGSHLYEDLASLIVRSSPISTLIVRERARDTDPVS